jgi:uncharacterized protein
MDTVTVVVPPINQRERVPSTAIDEVVRQIALRFNPQKIVLFGSYAYGAPRAESDVDLLVVMETELSGVQQAIKILHSIHYEFGIDLLVFTPQRLAERIDLGDPFVIEILQRGKVVYESPGA